MNLLTTSNTSFTEDNGFVPVIIEIKDHIDNDAPFDIIEQINDAVFKRQPFIPVCINSTGGDIHAALQITEIFKNCGIPIYTFGNGLVASAAALIFTCGQQRWMAPSCRFMIHDVSSDIDGNLTGRVMVAEGKEMTNLRTKIFQLMAENIGIGSDYFDKLLTSEGNVDVYLDAENCLKQKIATHIGIPKLHIHINMGMELVSSSLIVPDNTKLLPCKRKRKNNKEEEDN